MCLGLSQFDEALSRMDSIMIYQGLITIALSLLFSMTSLADVQFKDFDVPVTLQQKSAVREEYNKIPRNITSAYENLGNYITFFDGYEPEYSQLLGIYAGDEGKGCIILTNTNNDGAGTLIHEMAHFLDDYVYKDIGSEAKELKYNGTSFRYAKGGIRSRSELEDFKAIYLEECPKNNLITNYEAQDQCEYFAGSFAAYVNSPEALKSVAPKTYEFINNIVLNV